MLAVKVLASGNAFRWEVHEIDGTIVQASILMYPTAAKALVSGGGALRIIRKSAHTHDR